MSGVTLATAPRTEPRSTQPTTTAKVAATGSVMGSLRVIELQLVAFIMVFSASGLVPILDLIFPAFVTAYLLLLSRLAFPSHSRPAASASPELFQGSRTFRLYVVLGTTVGLFLPLAYVLGGFARGDDQAVRSATPHLFLLSFQILTENIISGLSLFSPPLRALVPLLYTVRRLFVIIDWTVDVWLNKTLPANAMLKASGIWIVSDICRIWMMLILLLLLFQDVAWFWFGKCLAAANLAYFAANLFGFLIPCFLPRAFERYFRERDEVHGKAAEDKRSAYISKPMEKKSD